MTVKLIVLLGQCGLILLVGWCLLNIFISCPISHCAFAHCSASLHPGELNRVLCPSPWGTLEGNSELLKVLNRDLTRGCEGTGKHKLKIRTA